LQIRIEDRELIGRLESGYELEKQSVEGRRFTVERCLANLKLSYMPVRAAELSVHLLQFLRVSFDSSLLLAHCDVRLMREYT
jgi:hypothetical protein